MVLSSRKPIEVKQQVEFLGFMWAADKKKVGVTEEKRRKYRGAAKNLLRSPQPAARWKTVIGKLVFLREAIDPALRHVRSLLSSIRGKKAGAMVTPFGEAESDLKWWLNTSGKTREMSLIGRATTASVTTDASAEAIGYVLEVEREKMQKTLAVSDVDQHINVKELEALLGCLQSEGHCLDNRRIVWYTDNVTARVAVMRQGTQQIGSETWETTKKILDILEQRNIGILAKHMPGALNRWADSLSREGIESGLWDEALKRITGEWGHRK